MIELKWMESEAVVRAEEYSATFTDARGVESTTIFNDGKSLLMTLRGQEFESRDFDTFEPVRQFIDASLFDWSSTWLGNYILEWEMPIQIIVNDGTVQICPLDARLIAGDPLKQPKTKDIMHLRLRIGDLEFATLKDGYGFEDAFYELRDLLPAGFQMRCCHACAFATYNPGGGSPQFGGLTCFRDNKDGLRAAGDKHALISIWKTNSGDVQETHVCPEFESQTE